MNYKEAKKTIMEHKKNEMEKLLAPQKKCEHKSFYRYWYSEDHLINVCRDCFYEWEENYRPFFFEDWSDLDSGKYEQTKKDIENKKTFNAKRDAINAL